MHFIVTVDVETCNAIFRSLIDFLYNSFDREI